MCIGIFALQTLNIAAYHFVRVKNPAALAQDLHAAAQELGLKGNILIAPEGLNLFLAGIEQSIEKFLQTVQANSGFSSMRVKRSWSEHVPFRRLKVRLEAEIITFDPSINPATLNTPSVTPATLKRWLDIGHDDNGQAVVLLDTRNQEEIALGTFKDAINPKIRKFTELPAAIEPLRSALNGKTVVAFCTGGIRCEKAVPWLEQHGVSNAYQLDGGILGYFESAGGAHWQGKCFVFDERVALDPSLTAAVDAPAQGRV